MILHSDLATTPLQGRDSVRARNSALATLWPCAAIAAYLVVVVLLQWASGAYRSEFSGYPDEPAHYVTSTMVWDFCRHLHFDHPLQFAQNYYDHYPKVALGHWPPFFYLVQAGWMLLFSASRASVRLEMAVSTTLLAFTVLLLVRRFWGLVPGFLAGLLCVALPLVQTYSDEEMAEILLTLLCFGSAWSFAQFVETEKPRAAAAFALFFALAVLTKGNGWLLAMIPCAVTLATGRLRLLWARPFLISVGVALAVCIPWQLMTMQMAERGWDGGSHPSPGYTVHALAQFLGLFLSIVGPVLMTMMLIGVARLCIRPIIRKTWMEPMPSAMFALILAVWLFHSVVPAGVEDRKLIIAVPAMLYFIVAGTLLVIGKIAVPQSWHLQKSTVVVGLLAACFLLQSFTVPRVEHFGYDQVARFISSHPEWNNSRVLISSNSGGEGLLISELAMLHPEPSIEVLRATKALATVDWGGSEYRCLFADTTALTRFVAQRDVRLIVVDRFTPVSHYLHDDLVKKMVTGSPHFVRIAAFRRPASEGSGEIDVYRSDL